MQPSLQEATATFATTFLKTNMGTNLVFHNVQHTLDVVKSAKQLALMAKISPADENLLLIAAYLHDTGYAQGADGHEQRSVEIARNFLTEQQCDAASIEVVESLIWATKMPQSPKNLLAQLLCDADLSHLGNPDFWNRSSLLRQELALSRQIIVSDEAWAREEIQFLEQHRYHSEVGRQRYQPSKDMHRSQVEKQLRRIQPDTANEEELKSLEKKKEKLVKESKTKDKLLGRGVETMYRTTYKTHLTLSAMADNKANLMLSVNAVIISIILSSLMPRLSSQKELVVPTVLLLVTSLVAIVFATLSTRPKVTKGETTREDILAKKGNLLFFGNFFNMGLNDYRWGMQELINDTDYLYDTMSRDLYFLGVVLAAKYRYLSLCYAVFMYGIIAAVAAFGIAVAWKLF